MGRKIPPLGGAHRNSAAAGSNWKLSRAASIFRIGTNYLISDAPYTIVHSSILTDLPFNFNMLNYLEKFLMKNGISFAFCNVDNGFFNSFIHA